MNFRLIDLLRSKLRKGARDTERLDHLGENWQKFRWVRWPIKNSTELREVIDRDMGWKP